MPIQRHRQHVKDLPHLDRFVPIQRHCQHQCQTCHTWWADFTHPTILSARQGLATLKQPCTHSTTLLARKGLTTLGQTCAHPTTMSACQTCHTWWTDLCPSNDIVSISVRPATLGGQTLPIQRHCQHVKDCPHLVGKLVPFQRHCQHVKDLPHLGRLVPIQRHRQHVKDLPHLGNLVPIQRHC